MFNVLENLHNVVKSSYVLTHRQLGKSKVMRVKNGKTENELNKAQTKNA